MKPLELTAYPPAVCSCELSGETATGYNWNCDVLDHGWMGPVRAKKRFTDAELAAEYYAQDSKCRHEQWIETVRGDDDYTDAERAGQSRMYEQLTALHRFATMPHYDEVSL